MEPPRYSRYGVTVTQSDAPPLALDEWKRHWPAELGATIGIASGFAVWMYTASVFVVPLQDAFGWTRGQIAIVSIAQALSGLCAPFLGLLVDRVGVRVVTSVGMLALGAIYLALANLGGSYLAYQVLMSLLVIVGLATSGICFSRLITSWFVQSRGLALSVSRIGVAIVGGLLPVINQSLIAEYGWQAGYYVLAVLALAIGLPAVFFLAKEPRDVGRTRTAVWKLSANDLRVLLRADAVLIVATAALAYAAIGGILSQLQPLLISKNVEPAQAAGFVGMFVVFAAIGAFVTGPLLDRFTPSSTAFALSFLPLAGCAILFSPLQGQGALLAAVFLIAFAQGAEFDIMAYLIARYLGMDAYSTVYGVCIMAANIATAAGTVLFGLTFDAAGDYRPALIFAAACFVIAAILYSRLGRSGAPKAPAS